VRLGDQDGFTPLLVAAIHGCTDLIPVLLKAGAAVNESDDRRRTALHLAVHCGHAEAARVLLEAGADADARDREGRTPRDLARQSRHERIRSLLAAPPRPE